MCLLLTRTDVAYAVIHREPRTATHVLLTYFIFRELSVAATLARYFDWHRNVIWAEQLPPNGRSIVPLSSSSLSASCQ